MVQLSVSIAATNDSGKLFFGKLDVTTIDLPFGGFLGFLSEVDGLGKAYPIFKVGIGLSSVGRSQENGMKIYY